ncbi:MAG: flagellar biosynthesis anti-sigma factor FlgM [Burkholderiales bacterium]
MKIPANGIDTLVGGQAVGAGKNERVGAPDPKAGGAAAAPPGAVAGQSDGFSSKIQALRDQVAAGEVVDQAKVDRVQKAIADGSFTVNAEVVADKMLQGAADMFAPKQ